MHRWSMALSELFPARDEQGLTQQVYLQVKRAIITCEIKPGDRLVEARWTERLKVSRTPLREALNRLALEDLVVWRWNAGYQVAPLSIKTFRHLCEVRRLLEPQCARLAARHASEVECEKIERGAYLHLDRRDIGEYTAYCEANYAFHSLIAIASGNPVLAQAVERALNRHQQPSYLGLGRKPNVQEGAEEHAALARAITSGRASKAEALMREHVGKGEERIIRALRAEGYQD